MRRILMLAALVGCGGNSPLPAGAVCGSGGDCEPSLSCLDVAQVNGSACTVVGKACSLMCQDDNGCSALGSSFRCFAGCTGRFCGEIAP